MKKFHISDDFFAATILLTLIILLVGLEINILLNSFFLGYSLKDLAIFSPKIFSSDAQESNLFSQSALVEITNPQEILPQRNWKESSFRADGVRSVIAYDLDKRRILYEKNADKKLPVASLTKLMTNLLIRENKAKIDDWLSFSKKDLEIEGHRDIFRAGESFRKDDLITASLMSSNNEATSLLARSLKKALEKKNGKKIKFEDLMNKKAAELGMKQSHFSNPIGFDGDNFSTSWDLLKLTRFILKSYPDFFQPTLAKSKIIYSLKKRPCLLENTNRLIGEIQGVYGSKTGHTDLAKGCMLLIKKFGHDKVILIILGSNDRSATMERLINWLEKAYIFD